MTCRYFSARSMQFPVMSMPSTRFENLSILRPNFDIFSRVFDSKEYL